MYGRVRVQGLAAIRLVDITPSNPGAEEATRTRFDWDRLAPLVGRRYPHKLREDGKLGVRGGVLEGNLLGAADAAALADVPDRLTLQAMLLGTISGPARSLATVLDANQSGLARVLQSHVDQAGE